jgi:hypothetical protein
MATPKKVTETATKPEFIVIDGKLVCQTNEGELKLPLQLKTKIIRAMRDSGLDQIAQFVLMLDSLGDQATLDKIDELDFLDTVKIVTRFFEEYTKLQESAMGESFGSLTS